MSAKLKPAIYGLLLLLTAIITSCKEDDYVYPPVKLEFMTANADALGNIESIITDEGEKLPVVNDRSKTKLKPNIQQRIVSNFIENNEGVEIYALAQIVASKPLQPDDNELENGVKTDPVEVMSISKGYRFINLVLSIKMQNQKHYFRFIEEKITHSENGETVVNLLLYHDANNDVMSYSNRAYMSIDISNYLSNENAKLKFILSYHDLNGKRTECQPILF